MRFFACAQNDTINNENAAQAASTLVIPNDGKPYVKNLNRNARSVGY